MILGEAGIGKSALCAWLVQTRKYVHHFVTSRNGNDTPENFLFSLLSQLKRKWKLDYQISNNLAEASQQLIKTLNGLSQHKESIVILIDALDESELYKGTHNILNYLPHTLDENVYFIVTSSRKIRLHLQPNTVHNEYRLPPLTVENIKTYLSDQQCNADLAKILAKKSEGNPLYLYYVMQSIDTLIVEELRNAPKGLEEFYEYNWNRYFDPGYDNYLDLAQNNQGSKGF